MKATSRSARAGALAPPAAPTNGRAASTLAEEVRLLDVARAALAAHAPAQALAAVDRYGAEFPSGILGAESTVVRIQSLLQVGNEAEANTLAHRFLSANPDSPLAARVRALLTRAPAAAP
jgi:hypothetical protein